MSLFLAPLSFLFGLLVRFRNYLYKKKYLKTYRLAKPVISVGNLTVGGTGKTPFIDVLVSQLEGKNQKVGLLTRGYGRKSTEIITVESTSPASLVGDEALMLKRKHPALQIAVGANRVKAASLLKGVDIIILDDGMQHLKIHRDLEITLLDCTRDQKHYHLLPWGRAREPLSSLRRSDFVILSKTNLASDERVEFLAHEAFEQGILDIIESETVFEYCDIPLAGKKVYLCSGIANPESFENIVKMQGAEVMGHEVLADHSEVDQKTIERVLKKAQSAEAVLITEKDFVKWPSQTNKVYVVKTKMKFYPELPSFYDLVHH